MNLIEQYRDIPVSAERTDDLYELFLSKIDDLSVARLKSIDIVFNVIRSQFKDEGFDLTELYCTSPTVTIKRNQLGFYVDETSSLNSKDDYKNYLFGKEFFSKYEDDFKRLNQLLIEKEIIMRGSYKIKIGSEEELHHLSKSLGYCSVRDALLFESEPLHPSEEYLRIQVLLDLCNADNVYDFNPIMNTALDNIRRYFRKDLTLMVKRVEDKYDVNFDNSYGIMVVDKTLGEMSMLYYFDGMQVLKMSYDKYLDHFNPYLEIYMRIILKCLKREMHLKSKKNAKK